MSEASSAHVLINGDAVVSCLFSTRRSGYVGLTVFHCLLLLTYFMASHLVLEASAMELQLSSGNSIPSLVDCCNDDF